MRYRICLGIAFVLFLVPMLYLDLRSVAPPIVAAQLLTSPDRPYRLSVGTIFKNEAEWLPEFLDYHRRLGVDHFYLYNNGSQDHYLEVLAPYVESGIVELIDWLPGVAPWTDPSAISSTQWVGYQLTAYEDCIKRAIGDSQWLAIIDVDEFIVPMHGKESFERLLRDAKPELGGISMRWRCFGTSRVWEVSHNKLLQTLTFRASDSSKKAPNWLTKCIYRPEAVQLCRVHDAILSPSYEMVALLPEEIRINHYRFRGRKDYVEKRWYRRQLQPHKITPAELFNRPLASMLRKMEQRYNEVEDRAIFQYLE